MFVPNSTPLPHSAKGEDVAVKLFTGLEDDGGLAAGAEVEAELSILGGLNHPHVLKASGADLMMMLIQMVLASGSCIASDTITGDMVVY